MAAIEELIEEKGLRNNIIFILEGEEEVGSTSFEVFVASERDSLSEVDVFFITDTGASANRFFQIFYALRGLVYFEVLVKIGERDLHSGIYGNRVLNPIQVLADLFAKMKDIKTGKILIPGFYDKVRNIGKEERELLKKTDLRYSQLEKEANVYRVLSQGKVSASLVPKILPSLDIHGIHGGYTSEGVKTVIPRQAFAKFSCRIVENQQPQEIIEMVKSFITENLPLGAKYELKVHGAEGWFYTTLEDPYIRRAAEIMKEHSDNDTIFTRSGGSIPAAEILQRLFKKPVILTGFTLPDDNIHSPNENFDEQMFWEGIEVLKKLYSDPY